MAVFQFKGASEGESKDLQICTGGILTRPSRGAAFNEDGVRLSSSDSKENPKAHQAGVHEPAL